MPIARPQTPCWIPRAAEAEFLRLLSAQQAKILPLTGGGGIGKTSLLRRFLRHCKTDSIPAVYLDLPKLSVATTLEMLLQLECAHTPRFSAQREKLRSSYQKFSELLQPYGVAANNAAELLQRDLPKDESLGLVVGTVKDAGKLLYQFWQREENKQHQTLLQQPEEQLLRALRQDFEEKQGVLLIDTLEQASKQPLATRLRFLEDGEISPLPSTQSQTLPFLDYCAGLVYFLFDLPVLMVLAGRLPAAYQHGAFNQVPLDFFAECQNVPKFNLQEVRSFVCRSLPKAIPAPTDADVQELQRLTHGNPFLLERVCRLLAEWQPTWAWHSEQWQPLRDNFQQDERHGLLLYVTERLLSHVLPNDRAFWRLALPRHSLHRDLAPILFPAAEFDVQSGSTRLDLYVERGLIYRGTQAQHDHYYLHDETRAALQAWAEREKCWLDSTAEHLHAQLGAWLMRESDGHAIVERLKIWLAQERNKGIAEPAEFGNPLLLEAAYHLLMADSGFEQRYSGHTRTRFWKHIAASITLNNALKMRVSAALPELTIFQIVDLTNVCVNEVNDLAKLFTHAAQRWMEAQSERGLLPLAWEKDGMFLQEACSRFPDEAFFLSNFAWFMHDIRKDYDQAESLYRRAIAADGNHASNLGSFAIFMQTIRKDYDQAESLYQRAIAVDPNDANHLGNFAAFMQTIRKDSDQAEGLYQRAIAADGNHASNLGNFARFMHDIRKDYDQAESLYQRAIAADAKHALHLGNFARFMHDIRKDYDQAESLYQRAIAANPSHANSLGNFAWFMHDIRKDYDQAESLYQRAIAANPSHANSLGNFAWFMYDIRQDYDQAESLYQRAIVADPNNAYSLGNLAVIMHTIRKDHDQAESLYRRAIAADANHANNLGNFAWFMQTIRKDYEQAESLYLRALEHDLNHANLMGNLSQLYLQAGDLVQGRAWLGKAFAAQPEEPALRLELWLYRYAHFPVEYPQAVAEIRALLDSGARDDWDFSGNLAQVRDTHPDFAQLQALVTAINTTV